MRTLYLYPQPYSLFLSFFWVLFQEKEEEEEMTLEEKERERLFVSG